MRKEYVRGNKEIEQITGLSSRTIYRYEKEGLFPKRKKLGKKSVIWDRKKVNAWMGLEE